METLKKLRGEHCMSTHVSHELKARLTELARKYDRTTADIVRIILKIGIPMMEGISQAEEIMVKEYAELFRPSSRIRH